MAKFATGKNSYSISDRSGFRYRYKDMRREWNGLLVGPDEWEAKHPQLEPYPKVIDAQALQEARPDTNNKMSATVLFPTLSLSTLTYNKNPIAFGQVGNVTVVV